MISNSPAIRLNHQKGSWRSVRSGLATFQVIGRV
jgi:hypothetical protein